MTNLDLRPDCARCDALCCVLLAFDASDAFAFSKPACAPCRNLAADNTCKVHATLTDQGFSGCVAFDCQGAGQRITEQVFKGRSWRDDPALLPAIDTAFRVMRRLHDAVGLLQQATTLPLSQAQNQTRLDLLARLDANRDWTEDSLLALDLGPDLKAVPAFLASLRPLIGPKPSRR
jgi:hypothetical protein